MKPEKALRAILLNVGNSLAELRVKKGYPSIRAFVNEYDLAEIHYWRIENGKANVTLKSLSKILYIHKLSLRDFFCLVSGS